MKEFIVMCISCIEAIEDRILSGGKFRCVYCKTIITPEMFEYSHVGLVGGCSNFTGVICPDCNNSRKSDRMTRLLDAVDENVCDTPQIRIGLLKNYVF
jgi:hypothetical protein